MMDNTDFSDSTTMTGTVLVVQKLGAVRWPVQGSPVDAAEIFVLGFSPLLFWMVAAHTIIALVPVGGVQPRIQDAAEITRVFDAEQIMGLTVIDTSDTSRI